MNRARPVVAIDGPAGAGKSTVALKLAQHLGFLLVDTGALYRGIALSAMERGLDLDDGEALGHLANSLQLTFAQDAAGPPRLHIDGADRSADIRSPEVSDGASRVSRHSQVREALLGIQRNLGAAGGVVLEGRDIGTVVFPDAEVKIFLTADPAIRAGRRVTDLQARGVEVDLAQTMADLEQRDARDMERTVAPLRAASDAVQVDTSHMGLDAVVAQLAELVPHANGCL